MIDVSNLFANAMGLSGQTIGPNSRIFLSPKEGWVVEIVMNNPGIPLQREHNVDRSNILKTITEMLSNYRTSEPINEEEINKTLDHIQSRFPGHLRSTITVRIAGEFSGRATHLIDASTQVGVATVQRKFDAVFPINTTAKMDGAVAVHKDKGILVATIDKSSLTIEDVIRGIEAINTVCNENWSFLLTPPQIKDLTRLTFKLATEAAL